MMTPSPTGAILRFENVMLRFDEVWAMNDLSFTMQQGETLVILGAAGSGKTCVLKAAMGLIKPDSGRIELFGTEITGLEEQDLFELRRRVGILFQEGGLFDSFTVEENVAYPLQNMQSGQPDRDQIRTRVRTALRFVELEQTLEQFPSELSGGMRRRVGIARAVVTEPPLLLYDSPTAGLDPITANTIMSLVAKERDTRGTAAVIVTHRYQDGQLMSHFRYNPQSGRLEPAARNGGGDLECRTRFLVLDEGRLAFVGTEQELEKSTDPYVSKFVRR